MFRISAITRVALVAVVCVAVAAPSALAGNDAKSPYWYAMSYSPTTITPGPVRAAKVQSLYGFAMSYTPTRAKAAKVQSLYGYAMSYTPTKKVVKGLKTFGRPAFIPE